MRTQDQLLLWSTHMDAGHVAKYELRQLLIRWAFLLQNIFERSISVRCTAGSDHKVWWDLEDG